MIKLFVLSFALFALIISSCNSRSGKKIENPLFELLPAEKTHINFENTVRYNTYMNVLDFNNFYNGGGVAIGDLNSDGLDDVFLTANMTKSRLYRNKGKMQFEDITDIAGVAGRQGAWRTGVSMADVNGDGKLDIYLCYSGKLAPHRRKNELFINLGNDAKGTPHFKEQAEEYGLADTSYTNQAAFFDYDKDGDLDVFMLNHNKKVLSNLDDLTIQELQKKIDPASGSKFYRNDKGKFKQVTSEAGIESTAFSYGLAVGVSDINKDGWPDIYVSNDYGAPDCLYINNKNGTFTNRLSEYLEHITLYSMGSNLSDINNDTYPDIYTLDMLPEDNHRQKSLITTDNYEAFNRHVESGFYYQYMRNMLHVNNGNGTFSEVGQLSGVSNTDWSWAPLFADYDNDGWKDLFVTNGYFKDITNMDAVKFNDEYLKNVQGELKLKDIKTMLDNMPSSNVVNYIYKNNGNLSFTNERVNWGMDFPSNSNGAGYGDLDNDGDLDLIVNNINQPCFVFENKSDKLLKNSYLKIKLEGKTGNPFGLNAQVTLYLKGKKQYLEQSPTRGFLSSVSPVLHFGLNKDKTIDSLRVVWLSGKEQVLKNVNANQTLRLKEEDATGSYSSPASPKPIFTKITSPLLFSHAKNNVNDFKRQPLLINPLSFSGPCLIKGDVNGDGLEDIYAGGAKDQPGELFIQVKAGKFAKSTQPVFEQDKQSEDTDAAIFDADKDGDNDLYVVSGGYHYFSPGEAYLQDRLYLNNGKGKFTKATHALPDLRGSKSCVRVADFNNDGYPDLFLGGRVVPERYPEAPQSYFLINDGKGRFTDQINKVAPFLQHLGMITDAAWLDLNGDKKQDLVITGEWLPLTILINKNGKLENRTKDYFDKEYKGWWNRLFVEDINNDGKPDLLVGNHGLNTQCKATDKEPAEMYYKDFDSNGSVDPVLCFYLQGKSYPYITRDELLDQMSIMRTRFNNYESYADATLTDIFTKEELKGAKHLEANYLKTALFINTGSKFKEAELPLEVQASPVFAFSSFDYDKDGNKDLLLAGNIEKARLRFGKSDANFGMLLKGNGSGKFTYIPQINSGFKLRGDVRSIVNVNNTLLFGINQQTVQAYKH